MSVIELFSVHGFIPVSKILFARYDLECAVLLSELANEYVYHKSKNTLTDDGYFYSTIPNVEQNTNLSGDRQRRCIAILEEDGVISCKRQGLPARRFIKINEERLTELITICSIQYATPDDFPEPPQLLENPITGCGKFPQQAVGNSHNIHYNKNNNNNKYIVGEPDIATENIKTIINYLNEKACKKFKATTPKTKSCIKARLKEGFSVEDFKTVIDIKTSQWLQDERMNSYLRPETLFGTKFESYLNEKPNKPEPNKSHYMGQKFT